MKKGVGSEVAVDINKNEREGLGKANPVPSKSDTEKKKQTKIVDVKPVLVSAEIQIKIDKSEVDRNSEKKPPKEEVS